MLTYQEVLSKHDIDVPAHLVAQAEVPVLSGPQRQGDVIVLPLSRPSSGKASPIPPEGVPVVRGENGGNTHLLVGAGQWRPVEGDGLDQGMLTVAAGQCAFLVHPEHGANAFGPGAYVVRRQREQANEIRRVAD